MMLVTVEEQQGKESQVPSLSSHVRHGHLQICHMQQDLLLLKEMQ